MANIFVRREIFDKIIIHVEVLEHLEVVEIFFLELLMTKYLMEKLLDNDFQYEEFYWSHINDDNSNKGRHTK